MHLGSMPASVRAVIDRGRRCRPLPGRAGRRQRPVRRRDAPQRRHASWRRASSAASSSGGRRTGRTTPTSAVLRRARCRPDATEIFQEGLRLPPVRLTAEVRAMLLANSRTPDRASAATSTRRSARTVRRRRSACGELVGRPFDEVLAYGERRMRAALAALPDGSWTFDDVVDSSARARAAGPVAHRGHRHHRRRLRSRSTSPAPTRSAAAT